MFAKVRTTQERDGSNNPLVSYTRGNDLSGSMEGAGGIGGLLARSSGYSAGNFTTHNYYFADGSGNITYMLDSSQTMVASYRYDPFGNTISSSGTLAANNVYRFSSKEFHTNSSMYCYGYRFYDPNMQRWINRDPIAERGGINLYRFVLNAPINLVDYFGLFQCPPGTHCNPGTEVVNVARIMTWCQCIPDNPPPVTTPPTPPEQPPTPTPPPVTPPPQPVQPPPWYQPPVYQPPVYQPPVYQPPAYQPPVYQPPAYQPPLCPPPYQPPVYNPPAYNPPVYSPP